MKLSVLLSDFKHGTSHSVAFLCHDEIEKTISKNGIAVRKLFAPLLRLIYATQTNYKIVVDSRTPLRPTKKGKIFAINHRQADDIVIGANIVNKSGYIVFGNPDLVLETTNGLGLWAYGMILLYRQRKSSRSASYKKMRYVLQNGGNVIIYPEGYWNLDDEGDADENHAADGHNSETRLMQDVNLGIFRLARETGCEIVPVALHYDEYKMTCFGKRGQAIAVGKDDDVFAKKEEYLDSMQTMLYELMEKYSHCQREEIETGKTLAEQWEELKESLRKDCDIPRIGYQLDLQDEKRIGKAKVARPVALSKDVFEHLNRMEPSLQTAFLWSKSAHIC